MPIWRALTVDEQPVVMLEGWSVIQTPIGTRHFVGWDTSLDEAKISTPISTFERVRMAGTTASGRRYQLLGPPCLGSDAGYLLRRWCHIQTIDVDMIDDVSDEYVSTGGT